MNLVSNAVKFTDKGKINITVKTTSGNQLEVTVSDTGMGIREEDQVNLFKAFQQIDMSSTKKHEGTGLGLYLCKKLTKLLGGDISAASQYGKGSRFSFRLPLNPKMEKGDIE
jgi:signal transduction histidine kinase